MTITPKSEMDEKLLDEIEAIERRAARDTKAISGIDVHMPVSDWGQLQRDRNTLIAALRTAREEIARLRASAPSPEIDEAMVERAMMRYVEFLSIDTANLSATHEQMLAMRAALTAALAHNTET